MSMITKVFIFWFIGMAVVLMLISYVPELLGKATDVAFSFGLGSLPEKRPNEFIGESKVPDEIVKYFNYLVTKLPSTVETYKDQDHCLISLDKFEEKSNYNIVLSPGRVKIVNFKHGGSASTEYEKTIGFTPCMILGESAKVFVNNLDPEGSVYSRDQYNEDPGTSTLILESDEKLITTGFKGKVLRKENHFVYLYKVDTEHICFIATHKDGDCNYDAKTGTVGEGCRDEIPSFEKGLVMCEDLRLNK